MIMVVFTAISITWDLIPEGDRVTVFLVVFGGETILIFVDYINLSNITIRSRCAPHYLAAATPEQKVCRRLTSEMGKAK